MFIDIVFPSNNEEEFLRISKKLGIELVFCYASGKLYKPRNNSIILCNSNSREIFESHIPLHIYWLEDSAKADSMHTRHSGMNHILAELAHKNDHTICFSPSLLMGENNPYFSMLLGRMMQNVMLCRKYNIQMKLATFAKIPYRLRTEKEMESFGHFIGMTRGEINSSLRTI